MIYTFYKYQGCGNDYIYFDEDMPPLDKIPILCHRHFGIGADGVVQISSSPVADCRMVMYNMDGSRGKICGNALRCVAMHLRQKTPDKPCFDIETDAGIMQTRFSNRGNTPTVICSFPLPNFDPKAVPVHSKEPVIAQEIQTPNGVVAITCVSMGNPHCVYFCSDTEKEFADTAAYLSRLPIFPEGVNVEAAEKHQDNTYYIRVLERGSGETLACGSGACAVGAAAVELRMAQKGETLHLTFKSGTLYVTTTEHSVLLEGPAKQVFKGTFELHNF